MAIKVYNKTTPGRRNMTLVKAVETSTNAPEKSLLRALPKKSGRSAGTITTRHKGGRHKRRYRMIDFGQQKLDVPGSIVSIERDPNRSCAIALINYQDGDKRYVLATEGMVVGGTMLIQEKAPIEFGNRMQLKNIPTGTRVSNVEFTPNRGGQLARSAGSSVLLMGIDNAKAQLKMASGEIRLVSENCFATIGANSNFEHNTEKGGKAGRSRWRGKRPTVRGSAMNPVDHPHGGGEGKQGVGLKYPKTPWGKHALGKRTRKKSRYSNTLIVERRKKKR